MLKVIAIGVTILVLVKADCMLPDYLQNDENNLDDYWRMHVDFTGQGKRVFIYNDTLTAVSERIEDFGVVVVNASCDRMMTDGGQDIYFFNSSNEEKVEGGTDSIHICVVFQKLTDNVVQGHVAGAVETGDGDVTCPTDNLEAVDWPLIAHIPREPHTWRSCPINGGFTFSTIGYATVENTTVTTEYCKDFPFPGQLQSECTSAEGMRVEFPDVTCIPEYTGWSLDQSLTCLDTWETDAHHFALVGEEHFKPKFCMRVSKTEENQVVTLFQDLYCPDDESIAANTRYLEFHITPKEKAFCGDDLPECSDKAKFCDIPLLRDICRQTCTGCAADSSEPTCTFDDSDIEKGTWRLNEDHGNTKVEITEDMLKIESFSNFTCHHKSDVNVYVMKADVTETCLPRYTCAKFGRPGSAVLQYKLSQFQDSYEDANSLCNQRNFYDDAYPIDDKFRSTHMKTLVDDGRLDQTVDCGFEGNYETRIYEYSSANARCIGHIGDYDNCIKQQYVKINATCAEGEGGDSEKLELVFNCLASMDFGEYSPKALITVKAGTKEPECWIKDAWHNPMHFYVMPSAQCDGETLTDIKTDRRAFTYQALALKVDNCTGTPTTDRTLPTIVTRTTSTTKTTTTTTSSTSATSEAVIPSTDTPAGGKTAGQVVGIVFGVLLCVTVVGLVAWFAWRQYLAHKQPYRVL